MEDNAIRKLTDKYSGSFREESESGGTDIVIRDSKGSSLHDLVTI